MTSFRKTLVAAATAIASLTAAVPALADITIGISLPLTGPASGLGIPMANLQAVAATIAGEKLNVIILDDATDPTKGVQQRQALRHRGQGRHHHGLGRSRPWPSPMASGGRREPARCSWPLSPVGCRRQGRCLDLPPAAGNA
jgi:branched-chain amino acid transport system substrate-binding protein